ncbi:MAG: response regulator [Sulfuricurvum sp.]|jgi:putative two-component system response regulator|uniref:HD domain-containing phosphohydrolase n=1 Tax=Sulfuricurvum sp. TaxID=2025608 RepID=UPI0025CD2C0C|nr:HD domain-containing phosphohydrolase [Sulfuricurvum sp.]MCK9372209.1 response regulator [Sulfuricurvum sp.]
MEKVRVLAVDDQEFNLDLIEFAFMEDSDVEITKAIHGREALDILEQNADYHVILLDLAMPVMDGFETLVHLKAHPLWSQIPTIVVTANAEEKHRALREGASDFLSKPIDVEELKLRMFIHAKIKKFQDQLAFSNQILEQKVKERTAKLAQALALAKKNEYEISARLGKASEYRDLETGMHIKRMSHYSAKLAELAGLEAQEVELILYASPLHDIGKVGIPDRILLKPGRFSPEEFEIMKLHSVLGGKMLASSEEYPVIHAGRIIALQHHEKYDGTGYPEGLAGDEIHLHARIVTIADVFDALSSERVYKKAFSIEKTVEIMKEGRGIHFDPKLLDLMIENLERFLEIKAAFPDEEETPSIINLIDQLQ